METARRAKGFQRTPPHDNGSPLNKPKRSRSPRPNPSVFSRIRRERSRLPKQKLKEKEGGVFKRLRDRGNSVSACSYSHNQRSYSRYTKAFLESEDNGGGYWKSKSKKKRLSREEDDLSQPWATKKGEIYVKDKALAILMVQPWERVARQKITQIFSPNTEIFFPPLDEGEGTEGPMIIEAEIGGHCIHRMANTTAGGDWRQRTLRFGSDELRGGKATFSIQRNYWKTMSQKVTGSPVNGSRNAEAHGRRKGNYPKKQQPAVISGVPRHISEHRLNIREGCSPVRQKKRGQAAHRNQAILEEVGKLVEAGIMKEVHYHDWLSNPTAEVEEAFKQMKQLIAKLPMLTAPIEKEELIVYLASSKEMMSVVLMTKREAKQMPIYFVSRALRGPELNYTSMEKLVLALVHASKRLKRYFHAHPIIVITDQPIQQVLSRSEVAGRLQKWSIELGEYAIHYRPRVSVKGKILADIIVERPEEGSSNTLIEVEEELPKPWILFTDRSSCTDGSGAELILTNPEGVKFTYALRFRFDVTNNEAEYEALIAGLRIAKQMGVKNLQANVDSRLVANQVNGTQVPRSENKKADALSKIASTSFAHLSKQVPVKELKEKSIRKVEILTIMEEKGDTWMTPIFKYLEEGTLPVDVKKARAIRHAPLRPSNLLPLQSHHSLDITLSFSPNTLLDHLFETPSSSPPPPPPQSPLLGHPIFYNVLDYHGAHCLCFFHNQNLILSFRDEMHFMFFYVEHLLTFAFASPSSPHH
nr:reverse transcriptase domain-containing protein [Tanacetum cinerariifolium]